MTELGRRIDPIWLTMAMHPRAIHLRGSLTRIWGTGQASIIGERGIAALELRRWQGIARAARGCRLARQADFNRSNPMTITITRSSGSKGLQPLMPRTNFATLTQGILAAAPASVFSWYFQYSLNKNQENDYPCFRCEPAMITSIFETRLYGSAMNWTTVIQEII